MLLSVNLGKSHKDFNSTQQMEDIKPLQLTWLIDN